MSPIHKIQSFEYGISADTYNLTEYQILQVIPLLDRICFFAAKHISIFLSEIFKVSLG